MTKFDKWWKQQSYVTDDGCYQEKYIAAQDAWNEQEERIREVIDHLENYPTCMSCYLNMDESIAATRLKDRFVEILREELL